MEEQNRSHSSVNMSPGDSTARAGRPKSAEKRENILIAASELFLQQGFTSSSMDQVAAAAGVSKQTVYSHFKNKDALFTAVIDLKCSEYQLDSAHMGGSDMPLASSLKRIGNQFVNLMQDESVIAMYRVVIGESNSNPHVAELFHEAGPQYGCQLFSNFLSTLPQLRDDAPLRDDLSITFFNMLKGDFHMRSLLGMPYKLSHAEQQAHLDKIVALFLKMLPAE